MKLLKSLLHAIVAYALLAFVTAQVNPLLWPQQHRLVMAVVLLAIYVFSQIKWTDDRQDQQDYDEFLGI